MFHLLLLSSRRRFSGFLLSQFCRVLTILAKDDEEHDDQCQHSEQSLHDTSVEDPVGNWTDPFADDAFPDQVGQHPVCSFYRCVAQGLPDIAIREGNRASVALCKVILYLLVGFSFVIVCFLHSFQQIVILRQSAQNHIGEGNSVTCVDVAEGCILLSGLYGNVFQHLLHTDFLEADLQLITFELLI